MGFKATSRRAEGRNGKAADAQADAAKQSDADRSARESRVSGEETNAEILFVSSPELL